MDVGNLPFEERLGETLRRTLPKLGPEARAQLEGLINPTALGIMAGCLIAWIVSHAFGLGEVIDIILAAIGVLSIGLAIFSASTTSTTSRPACIGPIPLTIWTEPRITWRGVQPGVQGPRIDPR